MFALLGIAAACSGAQDQDVLSNQIGPSTSGGTSGDGTSGQTSGTSGTSGDGTSGQTSGTSGTPGTSGGTTSSGGTPGGCAVEKEDSTENAPLTITSCAKGTLQIPSDEEDWLKFERPSNASLHAKWSGPIAVTFWDDRGKSYTLQQLPAKPGTYTIQIQYDFTNHPLSGEQIAKGLTVDWSFEIAFQ